MGRMTVTQGSGPLQHKALPLVIVGCAYPEGTDGRGREEHLVHSESRGAHELVKVLEDKQLHRDVFQ